MTAGAPYPSPKQRLKLNMGSGTKYAEFAYAIPECVPEEDEDIYLCVIPIGPFSWRGDNLAFEYTIEKGDLDTNGVSIDADALGLNGGSIKDGAGNDAILTHGAVADDSDFPVDGVPATVSSIEITSDPGSDNTYGSGDRVDVTVTMTEDVYVSSTHPPTITMNIGGSLKRGTYQSESAGRLVFSYTIRDCLNDDCLNDDNGISFPENSVRLSNGETTGNYTVSDATGSSVLGSNYADLSFDAVSDDSGHKVATSVQPPESSDATLSRLTLSGVDIGTFDSAITSYTAQVANSVSQTTVSPTVNHSGASYLIKLGGVEDADREVSLGVGSNVVTVVVTAEDDSTTRTYTVTVTRAAPPSTDATLSALTLTLSRVDFGKFDSTTTSYTAQVVNSVSQTTVTPTVNHSGARYVIKLGGVEDIDGVVALGEGSNIITVEVTAEDNSTIRTYTVTVTRASSTTRGLLSSDASLSSLTLSNVDFGKFDSTTTSYTAQVVSSVSQTTVTPTVNHSGASYLIKLGGVEDADREVSLGVGSNVVTVVVTAEDDSTTRTYTVTVTRAAPPSTDATLSALTLTLSRVDFGKFDSTTTSYTAQVVNSVSQTTVTPTVNHSGARYVIKLGGVEDTDGVVALGEGSNIITVEVTAEDNSTIRTYTVTVTRASSTTRGLLSSDASLSSLTLSNVDFGKFDSTTTSYTAQVVNSVSQTTVTPTVNHSGARYVIKLGGVEDTDGVVALGEGSNIITVEVTAEDNSTIRTYTVTVTRASSTTRGLLSSDASLSSLTLSNVDFGKFDSTTTSSSASVANSVSQTTVTPTVNHSGASYVIKLGGVTDADGVIALSVGSNVVTVVVTAEDGSATQTYTVTVTREGPSTEETEAEREQRLIVQYDTNENSAIEIGELFTAIDDYFNGLLSIIEELFVVIDLYFSD